MKRSLPLLLGVAALCVAADQASKRWASERLAYSEPIHVVGDLVQLTYTRNSGIAFGLFAGHSFPFFIFSIVAAIAVFWLFVRHPRMSWPRQLALSFILGGALGNLIDRLATGEVVDFILLSWRRWQFPVFNLADTAVTCGVVLFALSWGHDDHEAEATVAAENPPVFEGTPDDANGRTDGDAGERGAAGRPLAREGADRPLP